MGMISLENEPEEAAVFNSWREVYYKEWIR
jgi:hypothetical protein